MISHGVFPACPNLLPASEVGTKPPPKEHGYNQEVVNPTAPKSFLERG